MAGDKLPTVQSLEKPDDIHQVLRKERGDDCLGCKVIGSGVFLGLGAYSYFSGMSQLEKQRQAIIQSKSMFGMRSRVFGIRAISAAFIVMGVWRATK